MTELTEVQRLKVFAATGMPTELPASDVRRFAQLLEQEEADARADVCADAEVLLQLAKEKRHDQINAGFDLMMKVFLLSAASANFADLLLFFAR